MKKEPGAKPVKVSGQNQRIQEHMPSVIVALRKKLADISRESLIRNKVFPKSLVNKMPDEVAIDLSNQHFRAFVGMDRPNIFAGTVKSRTKKSRKSATN